MLKELILAIRTYFSAHRFIVQHKLWKWMIVPGILYAYLFVLGMNYFSQSSSFFIESIILKTGLKSWVDTLNNDLIGFFITMGSFWLWFTLLLFYFALFKYLFLILFAPFFAYLHLRIDAIKNETAFVFNSKAYRKLIARALLLNVTNLLWQTVYLIPIVIICTLPIIGWFTPIFTILIECYFLGAAMLDYSLASEQKNKVAAAAYIKDCPLAMDWYFIYFILFPSLDG